MQKVKALIAPVKTVLHSYLSPIGLLNMLVPRLGYVVHEGRVYGVGPAVRYLRARAPQRTCVRIAIFLGWPLAERPRFPLSSRRSGLCQCRPADCGCRLPALSLCETPSLRRGRRGCPDLGLQPWIKGLIGIAGRYDFLPLRDPVYVDMSHGANNPDSMPVYHVDGSCSAMLLVTGAGDQTVRPSNTGSMAARLRSVGSPVKVVHHKCVGHVGVILSLSDGFRRIAGLRCDMVDFIRSQ
jgi:hypothetical protein